MGVFAPNHSWREAVVPEWSTNQAVDGAGRGLSQGRRMSWAECLKRAFQIDLTQCPDCAGRVRFIAAIIKRDAIRAILRHLKLGEFAADEGVKPPAPGLNPLVRGPPASGVGKNWVEIPIFVTSPASRRIFKCLETLGCATRRVSDSSVTFMGWVIRSRTIVHRVSSPRALSKGTQSSVFTRSLGLIK